MPRKLNKVMNIVDLESTCWEPKDTQPFHEQQDIIEIGICTLNLDTLEIADKRSILVIPERSTLSDFCIELTTITPEMIEKDGIKFEAAAEILKKEYKSKDRVWASWGDFDMSMFVKECNAYWVDYPFGPRRFNLKCLFSVLNGLDRELAMPDALQMVGEELVGTHHRGHDDAENIAKIARHMFRRK